jgi:FtsH-binding integral membrane protein
MTETFAADSMLVRENLIDISFQKRYLHLVYFWMFTGLLVSGSTAYLVYRSPLISGLILDSFLVFFGLLIAELILVSRISSNIDILTPLQARTMYLIYTFMTGLTLSVIFFVYTESSIYSLFGISSLTFGIMSVYGYTTNTDLSGIGNLLLTFVIGLIIALAGNLFLQSSGLDLIISIIGVLVFSGLTAYDTQKLKRLSQGDLEVLKELGFSSKKDNNKESDKKTADAKQEGKQKIDIKPEKLKSPEIIAAGSAAHKEAIIGALILYLDFVNLFLYILRAMGENNDND